MLRYVPAASTSAIRTVASREKRRNASRRRAGATNQTATTSETRPPIQSDAAERCTQSAAVDRHDEMRDVVDQSAVELLAVAMHTAGERRDAPAFCDGDRIGRHGQRAGRRHGERTIQFALGRDMHVRDEQQHDHDETGNDESRPLQKLFHFATTRY